MQTDVHGNMVGTFYANNDRLGFNTPDPDATDILRPFLTVPYPAPWLPTKRVDFAHPVGANKVASVGNLIGMDKSGALIPAGYFSGDTGTKASGGEYCAVKYEASDVGYAINPKTGAVVAAANEYVLLASPTDGVGGTDTVVFPDGTTITVTAGDITWAKTCDLIPGGVARAVGYAIRDIYQYIGGTKVSSTTGGITYTLDGVIPTKFKIMNYKHEAGNAVQTCFGLRMPWIGALPTTLQTLADGDGVTGYAQGDFSRSFVHFTGAMGNASGDLFRGCLVVPSTNVGDAGHYMPYDSTKHKIDSIVGRVIGIESMYPIKDYMDRVRTQFDRAQQFTGPFRTATPVTGMMGGSATRGMDTTISYGTNGLFRTALDQGKRIHPEYGTYVYVAVRTL